MSLQLKRSLIRAGWAFLWSGLSAMATLALTLPTESLDTTAIRALAIAFITAGFQGAKKYADWTDQTPA